MKWFEPTEAYCELVNPVGYPGPEREIIGVTRYRWYWLAWLREPVGWAKVDSTLVFFKLRPSHTAAEKP